MSGCRRKTAFLVIHGLGQQKPFEALDHFARGLIQELGQHQTLQLHHKLAMRHATHGGPWHESFLRIQPKQQESYCDIHEYYWAHHTEEQIKSAEIWAWLSLALKGTQHFYEENKQLAYRYKEGKYFPIKALRLLKRTHLLVKIFGFLPQWPILKPYFDWLDKLTSRTLIKYVGEIAIYTTTDQKSRHFQVRQRILTGALELLESLLLDQQYDQVVVCGHSLGSVIAYDLLNRLNIKTNLLEHYPIPVEKLAGLVSFGSPLDKIAFFFREHIQPQQYVRRQIIDQLFSFKARAIRLDQNLHHIDCSLQAKLDHIPWINFYSDADPMSDHLDFCEVAAQDNIHLDLGHSAAQAHVGYWQHSTLYQTLVQRFLAPAA